MHPSSSNFYQNVVLRRFYLILAWFLGPGGFLKLVQLVKILYEICFFFANSTIDFLILRIFYV